MAEVKKNILTKGLSGTVGDTIVFRQRFGKTIVSAVPQARAKEPTEGQKAHRIRFQEAILYAKHSMEDDTRKEAYETEATSKPGISGFNVAVADFLHAPDIQEIGLDGFTGQAGDEILIKVTDDFKVDQVTVSIYDGNGNLVQQGNAIDSDGVTWIYTCAAEIAPLNGHKIVVKAFDLPGNVTEEDRTSALLDS